MKNRKRNRLVGYDYSKNNLYFVTSCVQNMECCFGYVAHVGTGRDLSLQNPEINHPEIKHPEINYPEKNHTEMISNHLKGCKMILNEHGIIANNQLEWLAKQYPYIIIHSYIVMPNHIHAVIEIDSYAQQATDENYQTVKTAKIKSLSQIMGAYKTTSSKLIRKAGYDAFAWHRSFHDHIIRDEKSYQNIMNYIAHNPSKWFIDKFYKK